MIFLGNIGKDNHMTDAQLRMIVDIYLSNKEVCRDQEAQEAKALWAVDVLVQMKSRWLSQEALR